MIKNALHLLFPLWSFVLVFGQNNCPANRTLTQQYGTVYFSTDQYKECIFMFQPPSTEPNVILIIEFVYIKDYEKDHDKITLPSGDKLQAQNLEVTEQPICKSYRLSGNKSNNTKNYTSSLCCPNSICQVVRNLSLSLQSGKKPKQKKLSVKFCYHFGQDFLENISNQTMAKTSQCENVGGFIALAVLLAICFIVISILTIKLMKTRKDDKSTTMERENRDPNQGERITGTATASADNYDMIPPSNIQQPISTATINQGFEAEETFRKNEVDSEHENYTYNVLHPQ